MGRSGAQWSRVTEHVRHEDAQSLWRPLKVAHWRSVGPTWSDATYVKVINAVGGEKIAERASRCRYVKVTAKVKIYIYMYAALLDSRICSISTERTLLKAPMMKLKEKEQSSLLDYLYSKTNFLSQTVPERWKK